MAHNPFFTDGEIWKENRAIVTPGFTANRIKVAYPEMLKVGNKFCKYIESESKTISSDGFNGRDVSTLYFNYILFKT